VTYPEINPIALSLGPVSIYWYGIMYLIGFGAGIFLGRIRARKSHVNWELQDIWDLLFFVVLGVVIGGRLGYVVFYNFTYYLDYPIELLFLWSGGMSFHGGLIGVLFSLYLFARRKNKTFFEVGDFVAPLCPIGFGLGRIGNFINQELWGRVTDMPWGLVFPLAGPEMRHPSQLYEAGLEGVVLFLILWFYSRQRRPVGAISGIFLVGYGSLRFLAEFFREPDFHIGPILLEWMTMGQLLCLPMVFFGLIFWIRAIRGAA